jgi:tetratricopeptide (TPR) repeat protein
MEQPVFAHRRGSARVADIFISYTSSDREWALWIEKELKALDHIPHIHEREIKGGFSIYAWMEQRHDAADNVLCVVSNDYLKAPYSTLERHAALWQAASKRPGFVLLVVVKSCKLPTLSDHLRRCELFGISDEAARRRFHEFMTAKVAPEFVPFPGQEFAVSNIPIRLPTHFIRRDEELVEIDAALARYQGRVAIALHGLRGVGKTIFAVAYAERHRDDYRATWWIRAQTEPSIRADLVGLGVRLGWVGVEDKEEPALAAVMERLRHEGEGILLIFDNAIDANVLRPYLPRGGRAQVLVTSNAPAWRGIAEPVEIRLWPKEIGADFLIGRTGRHKERDAAEALSEALGGLALAHEQAAAYCDELGTSLAEYRKRFEVAPGNYLDDTDHTPLEHNDGITVVKSFTLGIEEAAKLHPAAESLMIHAALLAPEPIPLFLFGEAREKFGEPLATAFVGDGLDRAIAALRKFALVDRETIVDEREPGISTEVIRLHRLVRQVAAARRDGDAKDNAVRVLIEAMAVVYPEEVFRNPKTWPRARRLDGIAVELVAGNTSPPAGAEQERAELLNRLGQYKHGPLAAYAEADRLFRQALMIAEKSYGRDHPKVATVLSNLAALLADNNRLSEAEPLSRRALAIVEKRYGPDHPELATALDNLATLLGTDNRLTEAEPFFRRALAIAEKSYEPDHPNVAIRLNNLAGLLFATNRLSEAERLIRRALAIAEKSYEPDHPNVAIQLNNLAGLLLATSRLREAEPLCGR